MNKYDLIIKNGNVVFTDKIEQTSLGIKDGKIIAIDNNITNEASEIYDAEGNYIFPGMIDVHVHFNEPGRSDWEGFSTGSFMIAAGGGTVYFDMPLNGVPSTTNQDALQQKVKLGKEKSFVDFGLWGGLVPGNVDELASLAANGVVGFKAFISDSGNEEFEAADDITLLQGMEEIAKLNKVLALHCESKSITNFLTEQKQKQKAYSPDDYAQTRPIIAEVEAVERALAFAEITGCPLHFVHISSARAIEKIEEAKQNGLDVTVETCAHYLLFNHQHLIEKGAVAKCAPPLRDKNEQEKLIKMLIDNRIDMITSDHSPSPYDLKDPSKYHLLEAWGGISSGQFTLMSTIEVAINHDMPLTKVAQLTAEAPAKRFGLSKSKGKIDLGYDADLAIISLDQSFTVDETNYFAKHKQSLFIDHTFPCRVVKTLSRGQQVFEAADPTPNNPTGQWLNV
ncbi:allantoinase [Aquibacillus albus]|uniref:Allantoinase n=1 Tax=Aquibacillus albus TaxID=1168171 RepID=A0ABS2MYX6_9BACI|nr:allantoinase [Aquibacillus albus]MBM7571123.1 allantoinase [Aquibacillus albus]